MVKILKAVLATILATFGANAFAQCISMQGGYTDMNGNYADPPRGWSNAHGCYVPQGQVQGQVNSMTNNSIGVVGINNQLVTNRPNWSYAGQPQQGIVIQQPQVWGNWSAQPQMVTTTTQVPGCRLVDKNPTELAVGTVISAGAGLVAGEGLGLIAKGLSGRDNNYEKRGRQVGAGIGLVSGATSTQKQDCSERDAFLTQQREERRLAQEIALRQASAGATQPAIQPTAQAGPRTPCMGEEGKFQGILNLPGHPKHTQTVCAKLGDTNISQWL